MAWQYKREETQFEAIPEGNYRVIIESADKAISKSGNDMLTIKLIVSGQSSSLWYYVPFLEDRPEVTNRMLTQLFDSFDIEEGNFNLATYVGKAGAVCVKHDVEGRARISYLITKSKQDSLPPFALASGKTIPKPVKIDKDGFMELGEDAGDDLPF